VVEIARTRNDICKTHNSLTQALMAATQSRSELATTQRGMLKGDVPKTVQPAERLVLFSIFFPGGARLPTTAACMRSAARPRSQTLRRSGTGHAWPVIFSRRCLPPK